MNTITFQQVFFGHSGTGYTILGASNPVWGAQVEKICNSIGTPQSGEFKPFLISVPQNNCLIMIEARPGRSDNQGRKTIFFHALIASQKDIEQWGLNALILKRKYPTIFTSIPTKNPQPVKLQVSGTPHLEQAGNLAGSFSPIVFISDTEQTETVLSFAGEAVNHLKWAGFSFQELPDFDVYVLSDTAIVPKDRIVRDLSSKKFTTPAIFQKASSVIRIEEAEVAEPDVSKEKKGKKEKKKETEQDETVQTKPQEKNRYMPFLTVCEYLMLGISLAFNIFLLHRIDRLQKQTASIPQATQREETSETSQQPASPQQPASIPQAAQQEKTSETSQQPAPPQQPPTQEELESQLASFPSNGKPEYLRRLIKDYQRAVTGEQNPISWPVSSRKFVEKVIYRYISAALIVNWDTKEEDIQDRANKLEDLFPKEIQDKTNELITTCNRYKDMQKNEYISKISNTNEFKKALNLYLMYENVYGTNDLAVDADKRMCKILEKARDIEHLKSLQKQLVGLKNKIPKDWLILNFLKDIENWEIKLTLEIVENKTMDNSRESNPQSFPKREHLTFSLENDSCRLDRHNLLPLQLNLNGIEWTYCGLLTPNDLNRQFQVGNKKITFTSWDGLTWEGIRGRYVY